MFQIEMDQASGEHVLVAEDGGRLPIRDDVWERLRDPDSVFGEWMQLLRKWSIHLDKAALLKSECPAGADYRTLRTRIRTFQTP